MATLNGKKILICRSREAGSAFETAFRRKGARVQFFSPFRIEVNPQISETAVAALKNLAGFDWLILSSPNGVDALFHFLALAEVAPERLLGLQIGTVGKKAARRLTGALPGAGVAAEAENLQALLDYLSDSAIKEVLRVLHSTSVQSLEKIHPQLPPGIRLLRLPLYRATPDASHSPEALAALRSQRFDAIVFTSPSSFDYFRALVGDFQSALAVLGETTAEHLRREGCTVHILPGRPDAETLAQAVEDFFYRKKDLVEKSMT